MSIMRSALVLLSAMTLFVTPAMAGDYLCHANTVAECDNGRFARCYSEFDRETQVDCVDGVTACRTASFVEFAEDDVAQCVPVTVLDSDVSGDTALADGEAVEVKIVRWADEDGDGKISLNDGAVSMGKMGQEGG